MINLNKLKIKSLFQILTLLFILNFFTFNASSSENKIIFKINNKAFTSFDYDLRVQYLDFVGNNRELDDEIILKDFISANLFFEYYKNSNQKNNLDNKINEIFKNIKDANKKNNKEYNFKLNKNNILFNIKIDFVRKTVLENILKSRIKNFNISKEEIDLLYEFKIKYINLKINNQINLKKNIINLDNISFNKVITYLENNNIEHFIKQKEIKKIETIDDRIKQKILDGSSFFIFEKNNEFSIIFIEKNFETFEGLVANLYSVRSKEEINIELINCNNLLNNKKNFKLESKEYKFSNLNNELKNNLLTINDYVNLKSNNENIYIVLCGLRFDKDILDNIHLNKLINFNVIEIEKSFVNKYSKIYNLIIVNA